MKRRVTRDEEVLWRRAMRDVKPLAANHHRAKKFVDDAAPARPTKTTMGARARKASCGVGSGPAPCVFSGGDPKMDRNIRRGRRAIDAAFDLHGHTQRTGRAALLAFLLEARHRGYRSVLVITGKGGGQHSDFFGSARGVLKARFQEWLNEPDFHRHIVRASPADPRHGGPGAFYVFLKR